MVKEHNYHRIAVRPDVYCRLQKAKDSFREEYPEFSCMPISDNKIIDELLKYIDL